jgi:hypothetical protein
MLEFRKIRGERYITLIYEELVENPHQVLSKVCDFLSVPFEDEMIDFSSKNHNYGLEDPVIRGTSKIIPSHGAWKSLNLEQKDLCKEIFGEEIFELNYWKFKGF